MHLVFCHGPSGLLQQSLEKMKMIFFFLKKEINENAFLIKVLTKPKM